jgi:aminoglycoside phosphotransferase (APT) family kinase protein
VDADRVSAVFGLGGGARLSDRPAARGKQGEVWGLYAASGWFAVKVPFGPVDAAATEVATRFHEAAYAAGVPTPRVHRTTNGEIFADVEGARVRVYGWVDVLPPDTRLDPGLVGATLAAVHRVPDPVAEQAPVEAWYAEPVGAERWDALVQRLRSAGAPFTAAMAGLRDELVALDAWVVPPRSTRTCHRDLWADNFLATADGGLCVIDWENSGPADPAQELCCALFAFARTDPGRAGALTAAYRAAGGPARIRRRGQFTMLIAQLGHIAELAARDWLEPTPRSPRRADSAAWIGEILDDPHTRDQLDILLAVARG